MLLQIILASIGSSGIFSLIIFLIQRKDNKRAQLDNIEKRLTHLEKDTCRTQMLLLMANFPEDKKGILMLAEHYFCKLQGNFFMDSTFQEWLKKNDMPTPTWFKAK